MANVILELILTANGSVLRKGNVLFDPPSPALPEIMYDPANGEITFNKPGLYSVKWWVATETATKGTIEFELVSSQGSLPGCSPIKTGQVSGFGVIDAKVTETEKPKLWLKSRVDEKIVFSLAASVKAYMLITQINNTNPGGLVGVYHTNLATAGNSYEVTIGNVVYRLQNTGGTIGMSLKSTEGTVVVDVKRSTQYDTGGVEGSSRDNYELTTTLVPVDPTIYNVSNEMHRTWIRQQDPVSGLWSMYEVDLFISMARARASICVYLIYENIDLAGL